MNTFFQSLFSKIIYRIRPAKLPKVLSLLVCLPCYYNRKNKSIVSFNTHDQSGGASKIAFQIADFSRSYFKYHFFTGIKKRKDDWINEIPKMEDTELTRVLVDKEKRGNWLDFSQLGSLKLRTNRLFQEAQVLHFHNLHGYYFSYALLPVLSKGKRVVWTLHDDHILTGHCSFTMQCERWRIGCGFCPDLSVYPAIKNDNTKELLHWKKKWINQLNPIIVSPSKWLAERVKLSYPGLSDVRVINNGIDISIFRPQNKIVVRDELQLPTDKFLVLFVAEFSTDNPFKGGEIVREVIRRNQALDLCFITIGSEKSSVSPNHLEFPYISNDQELAKLYAACDVLFYPTNADNFPLVVLEAMACGLPVVASNIAGIPEIIQDNYNGFLVEGYSSVEKYEEKLKAVYELKNTDTFDIIPKNARNTVVEKFSLEGMLENYKSLYQSLLN
jgi:glycosyltransferase involved in cell wall biosynthesis